ncbi:MAG: TauD/TfdA family dioxygenase, partial [Magnetovibrio sp.]|nr:TauD/TfdA family dioxygenase [Magnetovibrio sp.]
MTISIEALQPGFAATVTGVDLCAPTAPDTIRALEAAIHEYAVLVFPGQAVTDDQQQAFTLAFGPIEDKRGGNVTAPEDERLPTAMNDV